jgi:hypothetical protein
MDILPRIKEVIEADSNDDNSTSSWKILVRASLQATSSSSAYRSW